MTESKVVYAKPDYDEARSVTHEVTFRNWIGMKVPRLLSISYQKLQIVISEVDNGKAVATIPASCIKMAIPSENVETQVTILTQGISRAAYKVWVDSADLNKVKIVIKDVNKLVELYRDVLEEQNEEHNE